MLITHLMLCFREEAVRVFNSAPIIKRYDEVSLETVDAIYVLIRGFINKQRTLDNGFTPQVCLYS